MTLDVNTADQPRAFAVLLHPHPHYGGNRFHPFVDRLFHRLPEVGVNAIRFDFTSAATPQASDEAKHALGDGMSRWPEVAPVVVGYSFGAGIAATMDDPNIIGWYLLAPQVDALTPASATIGRDPRPKAIVVPEFDQFSPPGLVRPAVADWEATTVTTLPHADHFLGEVEPVVAAALDWIRSVVDR